MMERFVVQPHLCSLFTTFPHITNLHFFLFLRSQFLTTTSPFFFHFSVLRLISSSFLG